MKRVRLTAAARRDLTEIWSYSVARWGETQADQDSRSLTHGFEKLASGTRKGRSVDHIRPGYFKLLVGSHRVFYRQGEPNVIEVIRILHLRMDGEQYL